LFALFAALFLKEQRGCGAGVSSGSHCSGITRLARGRGLEQLTVVRRLPDALHVLGGVQVWIKDSGERGVDGKSRGKRASEWRGDHGNGVVVVVGSAAPVIGGGRTTRA
jgi:hypothetical protein